MIREAFEPLRVSASSGVTVQALLRRHEVLSRRGVWAAGMHPVALSEIVRRERAYVEDRVLQEDAMLAVQKEFTDPVSPLSFERAFDIPFSGKFLLIYICHFHVLSHFLLIYICKLHWNLSSAAGRAAVGRTSVPR